MTDSAFARAFSRKLLAACYAVETYESEYRLPVRGLARTGEALARRLGRGLARLARRLGFTYAPFTGVDAASAALAPLLAHLDDLDLFYEALADEASREALVALLAHRVLGPRRVRLPKVVQPLCLHAAQVTDAIVRAAMTRQLKQVHRAVELDPTILDKKAGIAAMDECLKAHADVLPVYS